MIEYIPKTTLLDLVSSGYRQLPPAPKRPITRVPDDWELNYPTGYGTGSGSMPTIGAGSVEVIIPSSVSGIVTNPMDQDTLWQLTNGQAMPPAGTQLINKARDLYYYENSNVAERFLIAGRTLEECSRRLGEPAGIYTGVCVLGKLTKPYKPLWLQVKTIFPFDRYSANVPTTYTLWVPAMDVEYTVPGASTPGALAQGSDGSVPGYNNGTEPWAQDDKAAKNKSLSTLLLIGGAIAFLSTRK